MRHNNKVLTLKFTTMDELQNIQSKIYVIRGQRVMLDSDIMLSSVLESDTAIEANRRIMRAFVTFHHIKSLQYTVYSYTVL